MWEESNENPTTHKKVSQAAVLCVRNQIKNGPHIKGLTIDDNLGATLYWGCKPTQFRNIVANCKIVISKELSCNAQSPGIQLYVQYQRDWVMSMLLQIQCWATIQGYHNQREWWVCCCKFNVEWAPDFQYLGITGDHNAQLKIHTTKQIYSSMLGACIWKPAGNW